MIYVAEVTVATDAAGTTATHYFTSGVGFATKPTDTPANTHVAPRLKNPGNWRREMFSGNAVTGPVRAGFGEVILVNSDGGLDALAAYGFAGRSLVLYAIDGDSAGDYPADWTQVFRATMEGATFTMGEVRLRIKDRLLELDRPFCQNVFAGTGGVDGDSELTGKRRPRGYGLPDWVTPVLVDSSILLYQVSDTGINLGSTGVDVYDGGVALTDGGDYTDEADLLGSAPSAGQYRMLRETGYLRLGSAPSYQVTARRVLGRMVAPDYPTSLGILLRTVATDAGISVDDINSTDISTLVAARANQVGGAVWYGGTEDTSLEAMAELAAHAGIWFGFDRTGILRLQQFTGPAASASATIGRHDLIGLDRAPAPDNPVWRVVAKNWRNYTPGGSLNTSVGVADRAVRQAEWRTVSAEDTDVLDKYPQAAEMVVYINGGAESLSTARAKDECDRLLALHGVERALYTVVLPATTAWLSVDIGDTVELTYPRFDLASGKLLAVVAQRVDLAVGRVELSLWG